MEILKCVTPVFLEEWRDYKEKLSMCIGEEQEKLEIADYTDVRQFLQRLSGAMEDMDVDAADAIMERLQQFLYERMRSTVKKQFCFEIAHWVRMLKPALSTMTQNTVRCCVSGGKSDHKGEETCSRLR